MKRLVIISLLFIVLTPLFSVHSYEEEIQAWRKTRLEKLTADGGWVTLAGLFWLRQGENKFGSSPQNHLIANYPEFPETIGVFTVANGSVTFTSHSGVTVFCNSEPVSSLELVSDQDGKPSVLNHKSFSWFLIKRGELLGIRMKWASHPNRERLTMIPCYPISTDWRIKARFIPYETPKKMMVSSVIGTQSEEECPGEIQLTIKNQAIVFYPTGQRDSLSLIFGDAGNGKESYSGGRFLPLGKPDDKNELLLDFNLAYNPPCVFTPFATCPIPVPENIIDLVIEAGEKMVHLFDH